MHRSVVIRYIFEFAISKHRCNVFCHSPHKNIRNSNAMHHRSSSALPRLQNNPFQTSLSTQSLSQLHTFLRLCHPHFSSSSPPPPPPHPTLRLTSPPHLLLPNLTNTSHLARPTISLSELAASLPTPLSSSAMAAAPAVQYRQSYVEKDRCVRNSTATPVPGVDVLQGFTLSKTEFEHVFLQAAETMDDPSPRIQPSPSDAAAKPPSRFRSRKHGPDLSATPRKSDIAASCTSSKNLASSVQRPSDASSEFFRSPPTSKAPEPALSTPSDAADFADVCRKHAASLQRAAPPDYDGAGEFFERACDARAVHGLFCTPDNADAHVEYAQNLSKRGLTPEAEYHLRTAADIYRMMSARAARKYGDVLLYLAVVVDRQGRLAEAENFYRSALAVYRANKLSDDNVRVAIDSLSNNLRAQGRAEEVDTVVRRHFLGAFD